MSISELNSQSRIKQDNIKEFEKLFKTYYTPLCNYANSIIRDIDQAEEIVQEFFYNYWKNRKEINIKLSLKAYIYKSVRNSAIRYLQHKKVEEAYSKNVHPSNFVTSPRNTLEENELNGLVETTLEQLPERCRQVFTLSRFNGLKYQEIADLLSISVKTVEADMTKTLMTFRRNLEKCGFNVH